MTKSNIIWTAKKIGERIGRSAVYVRRTLARKPGSPIKQQGKGNLYADETELLEFMRKSA